MEDNERGGKEKEERFGQEGVVMIPGPLLSQEEQEKEQAQQVPVPVDTAEFRCAHKYLRLIRALFVPFPSP